MTDDEAGDIEAAIGALAGSGPITLVPIASLRPMESPRRVAEDADHIRTLAEATDPLPPILVHRDTLRVVDGRHRLRAAELNGQDTIAARFVSGGDEVVFALAVRANVAHGLPLSRAEREAAATRIVRDNGMWSDRLVANITGLSARTIASLRRRLADDAGGGQVRLGLDGRVRPLDTTAARRTASELMAANPRASLREVARMTGISPMTVRSVRVRMARGENPVPPRRQYRPVAGAPVRESLGLPPNLRNDPAVRLNESGRELLRWLDVQARGAGGWTRFVESIPAHCVNSVAELATACAHEWLEFARQLERRARNADLP